VSIKINTFIRKLLDYKKINKIIVKNKIDIIYLFSILKTIDIECYEKNIKNYAEHLSINSLNSFTFDISNSEALSDGDLYSFYHLISNYECPSMSSHEVTDDMSRKELDIHIEYTDVIGSNISILTKLNNMEAILVYDEIDNAYDSDVEQRFHEVSTSESSDPYFVIRGDGCIDLYEGESETLLYMESSILKFSNSN
jgi:hypothetical protein